MSLGGAPILPAGHRLKACVSLLADLW